MKNEKGVTLIALVITIIVLLILASISFTALFGNNGIITKAKEAKEKTENAANNEQEFLNYVEGYMDDVVARITDDGAPIPQGFIVSTNATEDEVSEGLVIKDEVGNEFVWVPVPDLSDFYDESNNAGQLWNFSTEKVSSKRIYNSETYREPDVVTGYDGTSYDTVAGKITNTLMKNEFNAMKNSVAKYKGFYIGRYESGNLSQTTIVCKQNNSDINNQTWYAMYTKHKSLYSDSPSVVSSIIWGCEWDATLRWFNTDTSTENYVTDSTGKGNYSGTIANTGSNANYKVKNIYDMAGNVFDWTMEAYSTDGRSLRGGNYGSDAGWTNPASNRAYDSTKVSYDYYR